MGHAFKQLLQPRSITKSTVTVDDKFPLTNAYSDFGRGISESAARTNSLNESRENNVKRKKKIFIIFQELVAKHFVCNQVTEIAGREKGREKRIIVYRKSKRMAFFLKLVAKYFVCNQGTEIAGREKGREERRIVYRKSFISAPLDLLLFV